MIALLLWACSPPPDGAGTASDALTGLMIAAGRLMARPAADAPARCVPLEAEVVDGVFQLTEPCRTTYALTTADGRRVTPPTWEPGTPLDIAIWPIPDATADGVWLYDGTTLTAVEPVASIRSEGALRFPDVLPVDPPTVATGGWLVVIGGELHALPASPAVSLGGRSWPPWRYLDAVVGADGAAAPLLAEPSDTRALPDADALFIRAGGLPAALYAIESEGRLMIVEFPPPD